MRCHSSELTYGGRGGTQTPSVSHPIGDMVTFIVVLLKSDLASSHSKGFNKI